MRARVVVIAVAATLLGAVPATAAAADCVPARIAAPPAAPASDTQVSAYLSRVDRSSDRVRSGILGRSVQGRALPYVIVSTPGNLAHLDTIGTRLRALRDGRATRVRAGQPAIVWLAGGVHGNEPSGTDADLRILRELASGAHCSELRRLVVVIVPVQNPDGRAADTRVNANGFDLNRDWFAATQPETVARLALLARLPPIAVDDQHEQGGSVVSTPPNASPILPVLPAFALAALRDRFAPALRRALHPAGVPFDLFFPGYGDSASTAIGGAAGMTIEVGSASSYAVRVAEHATAARAVLAVAARGRAALLAAWARGRRAAAHAAGRTFLLRADVHAADAATLVARLQAGGVRVGRLTRAETVPAFHPYGATTAEGAVLPAGTWAITTAQPSRAWVQALLEQDAGRGAGSVFDDTSWSNPVLMGLDGGWTDAPLPTPPQACGGSSTTTVLDPPNARSGCGVQPGVTLAAAPAYAFPGDSLGGLGLAAELLAQGVAVMRVPVSGKLTAVGADLATLARLAGARGVAPGPADGPPAGAVALRAPRVALLDDLVPVVKGPPGVEDSDRHQSRAWMAFLLRSRLGLAVADVSDAQLAAGRLTADADTALVVADGAGTLSAAALAAIRAFADGGGTVVGIGGLGLAVAQGAGLTSAAIHPPPASFASGGATFRVDLDPADPLAWGAGPSTFVLDAGDPILTATSGVAGRHPAQVRPIAGRASDSAALDGSPVLLDQPAGAGRLALFAFDPAYRGYVDGASRLLANALLAVNAPPAPSPASAGAPRSAASRRSAPRR